MSVISYIPGTRAWRKRRHNELCRETYEHIQEIVDGEMTPSKAKHLQAHLDACEGCEVEAEVLRGLKEAIARVGQQTDAQCVQRLDDLARRLCSGQ
jgi:hypothetical protein